MLRLPSAGPCHLKSGDQSEFIAAHTVLWAAGVQASPLGAVRAVTGLLQLKDELPESAREGLQRIQDSARRMSEMIGTLLDFTHVGIPAQRVRSINSGWKSHYWDPLKAALERKSGR